MDRTPVRQSDEKSLARRSRDSAWEDTKEATLNNTGYAIGAITSAFVVLLTSAIQGVWIGLIPSLIALAIVYVVLFIAVFLVRLASAPVRALQGDIAVLRDECAKSANVAQARYDELEAQYSDLSVKHEILVQAKEAERPILSLTNGHTYCEHPVFNEFPHRLVVHLAVLNSGHPTSLHSWRIRFSKDGVAVDPAVDTSQQPFDVRFGLMDNSYTIRPPRSDRCKLRPYCQR